MIISPCNGYLTATYNRATANGAPLTNAYSGHLLTRNAVRAVVNNQPPLGSEFPNSPPPNGVIKYLSLKFNTIAGGATHCTFLLAHGPAAVASLTRDRITYAVTAAIELDPTTVTSGTIFLAYDNVPYNKEEWYRVGVGVPHTDMYFWALLNAGTALVRANMYYGTW